MRRVRNRARALSNNLGNSWVDDHPKAVALVLSVAVISIVFLVMSLIN